MQGSDRPMLNLCANNYLGLADHPALMAAATRGDGDPRLWHGLGPFHLRHAGPAPRSWRQRLARFLGTDDSILFAACFDANGGLFEPLLGAEDAIISDALNHASIIDGIRLCKARRYRYANSDMADLDAQLTQAAGGWRAVHPDRDGRRVLDGWLPCQPARDHARWPSSTARWSWWTTATRRASWGRRGAARPRISG